MNELLIKEMSKLQDLTVEFVEGSGSIRQMEMSYLQQALQLCLSLLQFVIAQKVSQFQDKRPICQQGEQIKSSGIRPREYLSLFGWLTFSRPSFHSRERGMIYLIDEHLDMPSKLWSYNIQELVGESASYINFRQSVQTLNSLLGLELSGTGSERNIEYLGKEVDVYYEQKEVEQPLGPVCFSASFDGKGVPKIKPLAKGQIKQPKRLGKGEKRGIKQMATVGVMSYFEPKDREVSSIIKGLMEYTHKKAPEEKSGDKAEDTVEKTIEPNDNRWHQGIHRRAFLADQEKCIDYGIQYIKSMMHHPKSRFVVPIDAGIGLEDKVTQCVEKYGLTEQFDGIVLDIIHVSEYVWDCANAIFGEGSKLRTDWVREMLEDLLCSKTKKVIADLQKVVDKGGLKKSKIEKIQKAITYFTNHQHKMDYQTFIKKGYPVSSALVESNCKHLVKDRMELSGMRWSSKGAQNMMDVRAVKLNGDLPNFIKFVASRNRKTDLAPAA